MNRMGLILAILATIASVNASDATAQRDRNNKAGLQFTYPQMVPVDEFIRSSKVIMGDFRFEEKKDGLATGHLHYPVFNTTPVRYYVTGPYKIRPNVRGLDLSEFEGPLMIRAIDEDEYEIIGYYTDEVKRENWFLEFDREELGKWGSQLFNDQKYQYEHLLRDALETLSKEPAQSLMVISSLGSDASAAVPKLRELIDHEDPDVFFRALDSIDQVASVEEAKELRSLAFPRVAKMIGSPRIGEMLRALQQLEKTGEIARPVSGEVMQLTQINREHEYWQAITCQAMKCLAAIDPESANVKEFIRTMASDNNRSVSALAKHLLDQIEMQ